MIEGFKIVLQPGEFRNMLLARAKRLRDRSAAFRDRLVPVLADKNAYRASAVRRASEHVISLLDNAKRDEFVASHLATDVPYCIDLGRKRNGRFDLEDIGYEDRIDEDDEDFMPRPWKTTNVKPLSLPDNLAKLSAEDAYFRGYDAGRHAGDDDENDVLAFVGSGRHDQERRRPLLCAFAASVVLRRGRGRGVPCHRLHRREVRASVEKVSDEGAAHVVRREGADAGLPCQERQPVAYGLRAHGARHRAAFRRQGVEERARGIPAVAHPRRERRPRRRHGNAALLVALAEHAQRGAVLDVRERERSDLVPAEAADVEEREERAVARAAGRGVAGVEELAKLAGVHVPALAEPRAAHGLDIDRARSRLLGHEAEAEGGVEHLAESRERAVRGGGRERGREVRADGGDVLEPQAMPRQRLDGRPGEARDHVERLPRGPAAALREPGEVDRRRVPVGGQRGLVERERGRRRDDDGGSIDGGKILTG
jgi:hypothetical protein